MDQPDKVATPARGQLKRENNDFFLSPFAPENLVSRDGSAVTSASVYSFSAHSG